MHHVALRSRLRLRMTRRSKPKKTTSEMKFPKSFRYWPILIIVSSIMLLLVTFRMAPKSSSSAAILGAFGDSRAGGNSYKSPQSPDEMMARRFDKRIANRARRNSIDEDYEEKIKDKVKHPGMSEGPSRPRFRGRVMRKAMAKLKARQGSSSRGDTTPVVPDETEIKTTPSAAAAESQESQKGQEETTIYDLEDPTTQAPAMNYDHLGMFPIYPFF